MQLILASKRRPQYTPRKEKRLCTIAERTRYIFRSPARTVQSESRSCWSVSQRSFNWSGSSHLGKIFARTDSKLLLETNTNTPTHMHIPNACTVCVWTPTVLTEDSDYPCDVGWFVVSLRAVCGWTRLTLVRTLALALPTSTSEPHTLTLRNHTKPRVAQTNTHTWPTAYGFLIERPVYTRLHQVDYNWW